jgi:hypothetical protein
MAALPPVGFVKEEFNNFHTKKVNSAAQTLESLT